MESAFNGYGWKRVILFIQMNICNVKKEDPHIIHRGENNRKNMFMGIKTVYDEELFNTFTLKKLILLWVRMKLLLLCGQLGVKKKIIKLLTSIFLHISEQHYGNV